MTTINDLGGGPEKIEKKKAEGSSSGKKKLKGHPSGKKNFFKKKFFKRLPQGKNEFVYDIFSAPLPDH